MRIALRSFVPHRMTVRWRVLLLTLIPASAAAITMSAFGAAMLASHQLVQQASEWNEHVTALRDLRSAAEAFTTCVEEAFRSSRRPPRSVVVPTAQALLDASHRSRRLAEVFSAEEQNAEGELARAVEGFVASGLAALRSGRRTELAPVLQRYRAEVVPRLEQRMQDEIEGARDGLVRVRRQSERFFGTALLASALLVSGALWSSWTLTRHFISAIESISTGAGRIASGALEHRVTIDSPDEFGALARAFNDMARTLQQTMVTRDALRREVASRTSELERSRAQAEHMYARLQAAQAQLVTSERMAAVGVLAAGVAHEVNNPLASMLANLRFALDVLAGDNPPRLDRGEALPALGDAKLAAERIGDVVSRLRDLTREDDGGRPVQVTRVIESMVQLASSTIKHHASIVCELGAVPPVGLGEGRLAQVVVNLVMNASEAMPRRDRSSNVIRIATRTSKAGAAVIEVSDNGSGMMPEVERQIFDPFFTTKPAGTGTGLGLPICKHIVESAGGEIFVETKPGSGSTFRVELPPA